MFVVPNLFIQGIPYETIIHTFQGHFVWIVIIFPYLEFVEIAVIEEIDLMRIKGSVGEFSEDLFLAEWLLSRALFHT